MSNTSGDHSSTELYGILDQNSELLNFQGFLQDHRYHLIWFKIENKTLD